MLVRDLSLGYLKSRRIGDAVVELQGLPLTEYANYFLETYRANYYIANPVAKISKSLKLLRPFLGLPTVWVVATDGIHSIRAEDKREFTEGRLFQWKTKTLAQAIKASNLLGNEGIKFVCTRTTIIVASHLNVFLSVLLKSDDPAYWERENKRKYEMFVKNRKIREVKKKIDRMV